MTTNEDFDGRRMSLPTGGQGRSLRKGQERLRTKVGNAEPHVSLQQGFQIEARQEGACTT